MKKFMLGIIVILFVCVASLYLEFPQQNKGQNAPALHEIQIQTTKGPVLLKVEKATTEKQRRVGLMNRKKLAKNSGMLFLFEKPQIAYMWMKNTYIPLDMIFVNYGKIVSIHQNAHPKDETIISSKAFVTSVLEVNAGTIQKYNIQVGDKISF